MRLQIADLAGHTLTRSRGTLAYKKLRTYLRKSRSVEIDVCQDQPVSLSFLDELVWRLSQSGDLDRVRFIVDGKDTLRKLSRVAEIRHVDISYLDGQTRAKKTVTPRPGHKPTVSTSRAKPLRDLSLGSPGPSA